MKGMLLSWQTISKVSYQEVSTSQVRIKCSKKKL